MQNETIMNKKSKPQDTNRDTNKDPGQDMATFEALPEKRKELFKLKHRNEKATGSEQLAIKKEIKDKTRKPRP
jgi:hypothetical protein